MKSEHSLGLWNTARGHGQLWSGVWTCSPRLEALFLPELRAPCACDPCLFTGHCHRASTWSTSPKMSESPTQELGGEGKERETRERDSHTQTVELPCTHQGPWAVHLQNRETFLLPSGRRWAERGEGQHFLSPCGFSTHSSVSCPWGKGGKLC